MDENFLKTTSAVYRLFDYFPEPDLIAGRAKERVLALSEKFVLLYGSSEGERVKLQAQISEDIDIVLGFLEMGKNRNWVSPMNFLIVCSEYGKIKNQFGFYKEQCTQKPDRSVLKTEAPKTEAPNFLIRLSGRQQKILGFLKQNQKAQVMDLQAILPDVT